MANIYKGSFVNTQVDYSDNSPNEQTIYVKITDTSEDDGSQVALELADSPIVIQTVDNSEDKFTPIKSKSVTIRVFTNDEVSVMTFAGGGDSQYKVEVSINDESDIIFTGWLSISDIGQTFQPDPNVLVLTATDGLGFLRDLPLSDDEGRYLTGPHKVISLMSWALQKTGLELDIWIQMNLIEFFSTYDIPEDHFYNYCYLNAQTFEGEIGEGENCFSVLEKILGEFCELSQQKNKWFIKSIDEAGYSDLRICRFTFDGTPIDYQTKTYTKNIGADETMAFMNDDARLSLQRPYKYVKQTFDYNYPSEIIRNIDFDRGDLVDDANPLNKTFKLDDWTVIQGVPGYYDVPSSTALIHRIYNTDEYEIDRYVILTPKPWTGMTLQLQTYARSTAFNLSLKDKFSVSVDWRLAANIGTGGGNYNLLQVVLHGSDGSWWILGSPSIGSTEYAWYDTSNWTTNTGKALISVDWDDDLTEWQSVSWEAPSAPIDGKLYLWLYQFNQISNSPDDVDILYSNLTFNYQPYINGTYQKYTGQQHTSEQEIDNKAGRDNSVFVSDGPNLETKGTLLKIKNTENLYSGSGAFEAGSSVTLDGFLTPYFNLNDYILISGTTLNNGKYRIVGINYALIPNKTVLTLAEATVSEVSACVIDGYNYELTSTFYDSLIYSPSQIPSINYIQTNSYTIVITIGANIVEDSLYNIEFDYDYNPPSPGYNKDISYTTPAGYTLDQVVDAIAALLTGDNIVCTNLGGGQLEVKVDTGSNKSISNVFLSVGISNISYPYGQHQNQAVWNQFNRVFTAFEATIDGLDTEMVDTYDYPDLPDLLHCYFQTDLHPATLNKQFKVLHYEQDTDNCEWGMYMMEVGDSTIPKTYTGHSFKYVQK